MEKNRTKYWLAAAMIGVWGLVAYRFYQRANPGYDMPMPNALPASIANTTVKDSFSLLLTYGNPFSMVEVPNKAPRPVGNVPQKVSAVPKPPEIKPEPKPVVFPEVSYKGSIKLKSGRTAAVMAIGGSISNLGVGEKLLEVTLLKIYEDSIRVKYQKTEKVILKARQ
jgi:hypothetical protein